MENLVSTLRLTGLRARSEDQCEAAVESAYFPILGEPPFLMGLSKQTSLKAACQYVL